MLVQDSPLATYVDRLPANSTQQVFAGAHKALESYAKENHLDKPKSELVETAQKLVEYQIGKTPSITGFPINIISVRADGSVSRLRCDPKCVIDANPRGMKGKDTGKRVLRKNGP